MKTCTKCGIEKEQSLFAARNSVTSHAHCKACQRALSSAHYQSDKKKYIHRISVRQDELRTWLFELKSKPCMDCGNQFKPWQMDFDHRDHLTKSTEISKMVSKCMSKDRIALEIAKCDLVCSNCHRDRTYKRRLACQERRQKITVVAHARMKSAPPACLDCGVAVYPGSKRCRGCQNSPRLEWPSVEDLVSRLKSVTFEALGRKLNVSGSAVRKHLAVRGIDRGMQKNLGRRACSKSKAA